MKFLVLLGLVFAVQVYSFVTSPSFYQNENNQAGNYEDEDDLQAYKIINSWLEEEDEEVVKWFTSKIRDAIIHALENIRELMKTGDPDLGIPPLDPLELGNIAFNFTLEEGDSVYGNFTQSELVGLSSFITAKVLVGLLALNYEVGLLVDNLEMHGTYNMDGHALGMHVFGDGNYTIDLERIILSLELDLGLGKYIKVKSLWADLTLRDAKVEFEHLLGGGPIGKLVNEALSQELPVILGILEGAVLPPLLDLVKNKTNEFLHQHPIIPDFNFTWNISDYDDDWVPDEHPGSWVF